MTSLAIALSILSFALVVYAIKKNYTIMEKVSQIQQSLIDQDYRVQKGWENNAEKIERLIGLLSKINDASLPAYYVSFENIQKKMMIHSSETDLLTLARGDNILISTGCYGEGTCGQCAFEVLDGGKNLNEPTEQERETLKNLGCDDGRRLACQCTATGDVKIRLTNPLQKSDVFS